MPTGSHRSRRRTVATVSAAKKVTGFCHCVDEFSNDEGVFATIFAGKC